MATTRQILLRIDYKLANPHLVADAFKAIGKEIDRSYLRVAKLNALLKDRDLFKEKVLLGAKGEEKALQLELRRKAILEKFGALVQPALTTEEKRRAALRSINQEIDRQEAKQAKINELLKNSALFEKQMRAKEGTKEASLNLEEKRRKFLEKEGVLVQRAETKEEKRRAALRSINKELEAQEKKLTRINALLNEPGKLKQTVKKQLQVEEADKKLAFEHSKERARQQGPLKALGELFGLGSGTQKFLSQKGGTIAGIGASVGGKTGSLLQNIGGGLAAAAGPVGLAIGAALALGPVVKKLAAAPYQPIVMGMTALNSALKALEGPLGPTGAVLTGVKNYFKALEGLAKGPFGNSMLGGSVVMEQFAKAMGQVTEQVAEFLTTAVSLAAKAQPGVVKRFGLAVDDAAAAVGHRMVPIVELLTKVTRGIGDVLHTILPSTQDFRDALAPLGDAFKDIKQALADAAPLIKTVLQVGLKIFKEFAQEFTRLVREVISIAKYFGLLTGKGQLQSSMGLAARPAHFTSPEEYAKSIYQAAFSMGHDPQETTADNTTKMSQALSSIDGFLRQTFGSKVAAAFGSQQGVAGMALDAYGLGQSLLSGTLPAFLTGAYFRAQETEVNPNEQAAGGGGDTMSRTESLLERIHDALTMGAAGPVGALAGAARRTWLGLGGG